MGQLTVDFPVLDFYRRGLNLIGVNTLLHDTIACAKMLDVFSTFSTEANCPRRRARAKCRCRKGWKPTDWSHAGAAEKIVLVKG